MIRNWSRSGTHKIYALLVNLRSTFRTVVIILFAWGIVLFQGTLPQLAKLNRTNLIFLILSGLATGLSWIFYFKALQLGEVNKIVPIDRFSSVLALFSPAPWLFLLPGNHPEYVEGLVVSLAR